MRCRCPHAKVAHVIVQHRLMLKRWRCTGSGDGRYCTCAYWGLR